MIMSKPSFNAKGELWGVLKSFRKEFAIVGMFSMVANLLLLVPTIYMLQVYDRVMLSGNQLTLAAVSMICLFLLGVMATAEWARTKVLVAISLRLDQQLSTRVFNASFESSLSQSRGRQHRAFSDLIMVRQFLTGQGVFALFDAPWVPIYLFVLYLMHPWLAAIGVVFAIVQAALGWFGHRRTHAPAEATQESQAEAQAYLQSKLVNAEVVEAMGMTDNLRAQWERKQEKHLEEHGRLQSMLNKVQSWSKFVRYSQQSLTLAAGAMLVIRGELSVGSMIASNVLISRALAPIDMLVSTWRMHTSVLDAFKRLQTLLDEFPERDPALKRVPPRGHLRLRGVSATATSRPTPILQNISTEFPPGTVTAVIGPSGSGKSTLARVMVGIWPELKGEVVLDDLPLNGWDRSELGPHIGYLPQDIELFDGTIAENIARFSQVDSDKVIAAAQCTGLHEMILRMPKGYDMQIGEAGHLLSAGQRQRIALARAVYGEPALLVLDEPNANLDDAGELALQNAVLALKAKAKTIILITHRLSALAIADRLLVLSNGRIQAQGPRDEVMSASRASASQAQPTPPNGNSAPALA
jgi:ATP-binding cassette, subfamily C, bacterial exporter for protease/lipase